MRRDDVLDVGKANRSGYIQWVVKVQHDSAHVIQEKKRRDKMACSQGPAKAPCRTDNHRGPRDSSTDLQMEVSIQHCIFTASAPSWS